jgi:cyclophilin family peptidyl-prolyl cis-trans isomerase
MKRGSGSMGNFVRANSEEYFVPLVDESSNSFNHGDVYDQNNDDSMDHLSYSPTTSPQYNGKSSISERSLPTPPLHYTGTPANPQSPGDDTHSSSFLAQQQQQEQQYPLQQQQEHRKSNTTDSSSSAASCSPDHSHILPLNSTLVFTAKRRSKFSFAVTAFCILGFCLYGNSRSSLRLAVREVNDLVAFSEKLHHQLRKADHDMRLLGRELATLDAMEQKREDDEVEEKVLSMSSAFANPELIQEMNIVQRKLKISQNQADKLKTQVSEISKQDAIQKYGSGIIRIKMELIFAASNMNSSDEDDVVDTEPHTIVLEMASLDIMPHSVYTFLEMVSIGLLDGCSFILNALHVLKAAPLPYDGSPASSKARQFLDHGLESVAFREYAPDFPHKRYTVGFAADGSPSFYINIEDNSEIHVGDPCFAKVVSGFDTIQRLENMPTRNGIWFEHRIGIKEVTIL